MESIILLANSYGTGSVLNFHTHSLPSLQPGFARIKVKAAGINPIDARRMTGEFKHGGLPQTFGTEFSGTILSINDTNATLKVGDAVLGSGGAFTHATVIDVSLANLIIKPENISWEIAGSLAGVSQTAATILSEIGNISSLLIHGGSGGVGSITIQMAVEKGITVVATASEKNQAYIKSLGAIPVVYGEGLNDRIKAIYTGTFDASVDMVGTEEATQTSLELVKPKGIIATIAGKPTSSSRVIPIWVKRNRLNLEYVVNKVAEGKYSWSIDQTYDFQDAPKAYDNILKGHTRGKSVLLFKD